MKIYNIVLHTYPHNPGKYQVILARTYLVMQFGIQQHFTKLQHFWQNTQVLTVIVYNRIPFFVLIFLQR